MLGNWIAYHVIPTDALAGMAVVVVVATLGEMLKRVIPGRIPVVFWATAIGMALTGRVNFLALSTPLLTYAGLSLAKDLPTFRVLGWRIVVTSLAANAGTFIFGHPHRAAPDAQARLTSNRAAQARAARPPASPSGPTASCG